MAHLSRDLECVSSAQWELQVVRHCWAKNQLIWRLAVNNKPSVPGRGASRWRERSSAAPRTSRRNCPSCENTFMWIQEPTDEATMSNLSKGGPKKDTKMRIRAFPVSVHRSRLPRRPPGPESITAVWAAGFTLADQPAGQHTWLV